MTEEFSNDVAAPDFSNSRARVHGPGQSAPGRRPGSIRRTTTIDMRWADGWGTDLYLDGRGRDLRTAEDRSTKTLATSRMRLDVDPRRNVLRIEAEPGRPGIEHLVGGGAGSGFRRRLGDAVPSITGHDPVDLMLDDVPGATLVSGFAFAQWYPIEQLLADVPRSPGPARRTMVGICTGFMPGSSGLAPDGTSRWTHRTRPVEPLDSVPDRSPGTTSPRSPRYRCGGHGGSMCGETVRRRTSTRCSKTVRPARPGVGSQYTSTVYARAQIWKPGDSRR